MCPEHFTLNLKIIIGIIICFQDINNYLFSYSLFSPRKKEKKTVLLKRGFEKYKLKAAE